MSVSLHEYPELDGGGAEDPGDAAEAADPLPLQQAGHARQLTGQEVAVRPQEP